MPKAKITRLRVYLKFPAIAPLITAPKILRIFKLFDSGLHSQPYATGAWLQPDRFYLVITQNAAERLKNLVDPQLLTIVAQSGGKLLLTNHPVVR